MIDTNDYIKVMDHSNKYCPVSKIINISAITSINRFGDNYAMRFGGNEAVVVPPADARKIFDRIGISL